MEECSEKEKVETFLKHLKEKLEVAKAEKLKQMKLELKNKLE